MFVLHYKGESRHERGKNLKRKGARFSNKSHSWKNGHRRNPTRKRGGKKRKVQ